MDLEDIFSEFALDLMHRIESGQYTHEGKMHKWIGYIWGNFFFPEIETNIFGYLARNTYVNTLDPELQDYEFQNHAEHYCKSKTNRLDVNKQYMLSQSPETAS